MPRRSVGSRYAARADSPAASGETRKRAWRRPPSKGSRRPKTGVRRLPALRTTSSTRLSVPAYTRGGCSSRCTLRRGPGRRASSTANPTRAAAPVPSTRRSTAPSKRPETHSTPAPMSSVQPRAVITWCVSSRSARTAGGDLHAADGVGQHIASGDTPHLRFRRERQTVFEHRDGELLEVVRHDVLTAEGRGACSCCPLQAEGG